MIHDPWREVEAEAQRLMAAAEDARKLPRTPPRFEEPPEGMGDLAVPTFAYAKAARKAPPEIAKALAGAMPASPWFPKVEAAGGYVNFHINAAKYNSNDEDRVTGTDDIWRLAEFCYAAVDTDYQGWFGEDQFTYRMEPVKAMALMYARLVSPPANLMSRQKQPAHA